MFPMPRHPRDGSILSTEDIWSVQALPSVRTRVTVSKLSEACRCSIADVSPVIEVSHLVSLGSNEVTGGGGVDRKYVMVCSLRPPSEISNTGDGACELVNYLLRNAMAYGNDGFWKSPRSLSRHIP